MPIDSIHRIPNFQVAESNETSDEERRRNKKKTLVQKKGSSTSSESLVNQVGSKEENPGNETQSLQSQPIDTKKVVELLSHRPEGDPQAYAAKIRVISKIADVKKPTLSRPKSVNKSA